MATDVDEAGNEILDKIFYYADWQDDDEDPPESIVIAQKLEGHPRAFIDELGDDGYPALFVQLLGWPANERIAKQDRHTFSWRLYLMIAATAGTNPYREAREQVMQVKRNIIAARPVTGHLLGLDYLAEMRWTGTMPENEVAAWLRDAQMAFACCAVGFNVVTYSGAEDYGA